MIRNFYFAGGPSYYPVESTSDGVNNKQIGEFQDFLEEGIHTFIEISKKSQLFTREYDKCM